MPKLRENPEGREGEKKIDCEHYRSCLAYAARENWQAFTCEECDYFGSELKGDRVDTNDVENDRMCADCWERPTMSPKHSLCPQCMGKKAKKKGPKKARKKGSAGPKKKTGGKSLASKKPQEEAKRAITIDFDQHPEIYDDIIFWAEEEMRPVEVQIIYMLKRYLTDNRYHQMFRINK